MENHIEGYQLTIYLNNEYKNNSEFKLNFSYSFLFNENEKGLVPSLNILNKKVNLEDVIFSFCLDKGVAESSRKGLIEKGFATSVDIDGVNSKRD